MFYPSILFTLKRKRCFFGLKRCFFYILLDAFLIPCDHRVLFIHPRKMFSNIYFSDVFWDEHHHAYVFENIRKLLFTHFQMRSIPPVGSLYPTFRMFFRTCRMSLFHLSDALLNLSDVFIPPFRCSFKPVGCLYSTFRMLFRTCRMSLFNLSDALLHL